MIDQANFTQEQIVKLWQVLDPGIMKKFADPSCLASPGWRGVVRIERHRAELQQLETTAASTDAGLPLKDRAGPFPFDRQRYRKHQRKCYCVFRAFIALVADGML